jgi:hypothetical protein
MKIVINADNMEQEGIDRIVNTLSMMGVSKISYENTEFSLKDGKRFYKRESFTPNITLVPTPSEVTAFLEDLQQLLKPYIA